MVVRRCRPLAVFALIAALAWFGAAKSAMQSAYELESQQVALAQHVRDAMDAVAACDQDGFTRASLAIDGLRKNADRARRHLVEQELDLGLALRALLEKQQFVGDSALLREEIERLERAKRELDVPIKAWQRLVLDAGRQFDELTGRYKENCEKQKAAGERTRTRVSSPEPKPMPPPKEATSQPVEPAPGAPTVCAPCQELANQLAEAEQDFFRAQRRFASAHRALQEALIAEANLERRLKELLDRFNHQIGKGASSGVDPTTGRPIDSRFTATGQVQITTTNPDGTTSTTLRDSNYMNALKEQIKKTEAELEQADNEGLRLTRELMMAKAELQAATERCDELEKALDDCIKKYCTKSASGQARLGDASGAGDLTRWRGSAPGVVVGGGATKPDDPNTPFEYVPAPKIRTGTPRVLDLLRTSPSYFNSSAASAPVDPVYQLMIVIVGRMTIPARKMVDAKPASYAPRFSAVSMTFGWTRPSRLTAGVDVFADARARRGQNTADAAAIPRVRAYLTSLGVSTGEAFELRVQNDDAAAVDLVGDGVVVEPIQERAATQTRREIQKMPADGVISMTMQGYCLELLREPPVKNMLFRIASPEMQQRFEPARRILGAAQRLQDKRALTADSDPTAYFHSIRQWALWTNEQRFNGESFGKAFVEHTRKNLQASGRQWSKPIEDAVRGFVPGRWRDIQQVLTEAGIPSAR